MSRRCSRLFALLLILIIVPAAVAEGPVVPVSRPVQREFIDGQDFTGRIVPVKFVQLRARVSGYLEKAPFQEGSLVKKGQLLFVLDARPYQAELDRAKAAVTQAEARLRLATADLERARKLVPRGAMSREEYDKIAGERTLAAATIQAVKASVEVAALNLEFTRVTAPFDGRISRRLLAPGALVKGDDTVLATLVSTGPVYCYFDIDERTLLRSRRLLMDQKGETAKLPLLLGLSNEQGLPHKGTLDLIDIRLDEKKGAIQARGIFPNADGALFPGLFARLRLLLGKPRKVLEVPELAVLSKDGKKFVYVVGADKKVELRPVKLGSLDGRLRVVEEGLKPDDWVAVSALGKFAEGDTVEPKRSTVPGGRE